MNLRELIATTLTTDAEMIALGLQANAVFQAETAESPFQRPFITVRFGETEAGVGRMKRKPFAVWVHDEPGDFSRAEKVAARAGALLSSLEQIPLNTPNWLLMIEDVGLGSDFYDDGFNTLVIPYRLRAVASGL